jgi:ABC-type sugar transport system ATPase subunit
VVSEGEQPAPAARLQLSEVVKNFDAVLAVDAVSFEVQGGEVHALLGENGAGKSTLIRLLAGDYPPDSGEIRLDGREFRPSHPREAIEHGIACVHQTPLFVPNFSVTENLLLGLPYEQRRAGFIDWASEHRQAQKALAEVGLALDPSTRLADLELHERQFVALARALRQEPRVLMLDEITASLAEREVRRLYEVVRRVRDEGVAVVYVSHRLEEVFDIADRATVLRDGRHIATSSVDGLTHRKLTELIVGRDIEDVISQRQTASRHRDGEPVLVARNIGDGKQTSDISFELRAGEILGIAGLAGSGQSSVLRMLFGADRVREGNMSLEGGPYSPRHPSEAIEAGVAMVTEDRHHDGLVQSLPVWQNTTLPWVTRFRRGILLRLHTERVAAEKQTRRLGVRMPSIDATMSLLSGGNQQKVVLAKWISGSPRMLILDEPTHGVDIGSRYEIYDIVKGLAARGVAIIVVSSEFEELETLCDRVLLLRAGRLLGELSDSDVTEDRILSRLLAAHGSQVQDAGSPARQ